MQKHLGAGRTQIAQLLLSSWKETWLDAGRIRWIRVAPKLVRKYMAASRTRSVRVALVSTSRIRWVRVVLGCSASAWKLFPWEIVGLAAGRTRWVRVAPNTAIHHSGQFFHPYLKG